MLDRQIQYHSLAFLINRCTCHLGRSLAVCTDHSGYAWPSNIRSIFWSTDIQCVTYAWAIIRRLLHHQNDRSTFLLPVVGVMYKNNHTLLNGCSCWNTSIGYWDWYTTRSGTLYVPPYLDWAQIYFVKPWWGFDYRGYFFASGAKPMQ